MTTLAELIAGGGMDDDTDIADISVGTDDLYSSAGITPEMAKGMYENAGPSSRESLSASIVQLLPMVVAALSGGGSERFMNAGAAGAQAGSDSIKAFTEQSKRRQQLDMLGVKSAFGTAAAAKKEAAMSARQKAARTQQYEHDDQKAKEGRDWDVKKMGMEEDSRMRTAKYTASLKPANETRPADPARVADLRETLIKNGRLEAAESVKDGMTEKEYTDTVGRYQTNIFGLTKIEKQGEVNEKLEGVKQGGRVNLMEQANAWKDSDREDKQTQSEKELGIKATQQNLDREDKQLEGKESQQRGFNQQEKMFGQKAMLDQTMQGEREAAQKRVLDYKAEIDANKDKDTVEPWEIENVRKMATLIHGENGYEPLPDTMSRKQLNNMASVLVKDGRVAAMQNQRFTEDRAKVSSDLIMPAANPTNAIGGKKFSPKDFDLLEKGTKAIGGLMQTTDKLQKLYDPKTKSVDPNTIIQLSNELVNQVKELQGMGANFTIMESGIVKGQIGVAPLEPTVDAVEQYIKRRLVMGGDFYKNLGVFKEQMAQQYLSEFAARGGMLNVNTKDPFAQQTLRSLGQTQIGRKQLAYYRSLLGESGRATPAASASPFGAAAAPAAGAAPSGALEKIKLLQAERARRAAERGVQ